MTAIIGQNFESPTVVHDKASASGKSIVWPSSPTATVVYDESSATGMTVVWPVKSSCGSLERQIQPSVASTRANSVDGSGSADDAECVMQSQFHGAFDGSLNKDKENMGALGLRRGIRNAILDDLGVELECDSYPGVPTPTTTAGSPYLSSVGSPVLAEHMLCTPNAAMSASPFRKCPDASQRSPTGRLLSPTFLCSPHSCDASQRTPPQVVPQHINGGLLQPCDASQRKLSQRVGQRMANGLHVTDRSGGDASERSPVGSWNAAVAAVAATRNAATSCAMPVQAMNGVPNTAAGGYPLVAAETVALAQVALQAADAMALTRQVSSIAPSMAVPFVAENASPLDQAARASTGNVEVVSTDALKCWLAGISESELRAALPETYDD